MPTSGISKLLAHNLRLYRANLELSQSEIAKKSGITTRSYQGLESGKGNPTLHTIEILASALEITASDLISLKKVRLKETVEQFLLRFDKIFLNERIGASIRNFDGVLIYRNKKFREFFKAPELSNGTVDLLSVLPRGSKETLKSQLSSERRGLASSYVNFFEDKNTAEMRFYRFYPCLVSSSNGSELLFSAMYATPIEEDCQKNYYRFCKGLITCL